MKKNIVIIILVVFIISAIIYFDIIKYEKSICIKSRIDENFYKVKDLDDKGKAADILAMIRKQMIYFTKHLMANREDKYHEFKEYIEMLNNKIMQVKFKENINDNSSTSFSLNKGEELNLCIRSKKDKNRKIHDMNLINYVTIHELAHIACPEYGHTELFLKIYKFFLNVSKDINLYKDIDFTQYPVEYCGMMIKF